MKLNVSLRITVFWDVTPYSLVAVINQRYVLLPSSGQKNIPLMMVSTKITMFWNVIPCSVVELYVLTAKQKTSVRAGGNQSHPLLATCLYAGFLLG
jgi:hypothetical protein